MIRIPPMTEPLGYAPPVPPYRRVGFVALVTIPVLIASYVLAVPKFRTFRDHQARRADVRRQFATEIAAARKEIEANNLDAAAAALFNAEFPTRIERHLFTRSTLAAFDRVLAGVRPRIDQAIAKRRADQEILARQAQAQREREEEEERRSGTVVIRCYAGGNLENKLRTIAALHDRAAVALRAGNNQQAFGICQQIVVLDPGHKFDAEFWKNVQPRP
jgi:hypothetical protein